MNLKFFHSLAVTAFVGTTHFLCAATLLTDDFTVTTSANLDPNFEIANRQTGPKAISEYFISNQNSSFGVQLGNTTTDVGQPGGPTNGNYLLLADDCGVQNLLELNETLAGGQPLNFTFDLYVKSQGAAQDVWNSFTLRLPGTSFPIAGAGEFGMLRRANGGMQFFTNGVVVGDLPEGSASLSLFSVTFSDLAGTGSPFAGNGSKVIVLNGEEVLFEYEFAADNALSSDGLLFGFNTIGGAVGGVDNLTVSVVPEPSTVAFLAVGAAGAVVLASRRRRA